MNNYQFNCDFCGKLVFKPIGNHPERPSRILRNTKFKRTIQKSKGHKFCDVQCQGKFNNKQIEVNCEWCGKSRLKKLTEISKSKSGFSFCNKSCSASFNNTKKRKSKRSKCEKFLFELIKNDFPTLDVIPNDKVILDGYEVDIAIPSINLCIEWNGIVHFEPIYGIEKLNNIQKRDSEKRQIAIKNKINLIVIPDLVSSEKYVKEAFFKIRQIIEQQMKRP